MNAEGFTQRQLGSTQRATHLKPKSIIQRRYRILANLSLEVAEGILYLKLPEKIAMMTTEPISKTSPFTLNQALIFSEAIARKIQPDSTTDSENKNAVLGIVLTVLLGL